MSAMPRCAPQLNCPLCGGLGAARHTGVTDRAHDIAGSWSFLTCGPCEIGWLHPQPIDADLALCYPGHYYTHKAEPAPRSAFGAPGWKGRLRDMILAGRYRYPVASTSPVTRALGRALGHIAPLRNRLAYRRDNALPVWRDGGRLLDIGCGSGQHLRLAQSLGWQAFGIDPDPAAVAAAGESGAVVQLGTLDTADLPEAPFDAVTSLHAIEHARDPRRFIRQALALLRPGGFFYLQTPNFGSLLHRRFGPDWYALESSRHLCLLTAPALTRLLREAGAWESLRVRSLPRRAVREQEQTLAMRRTGSFEAFPAFSTLDRFSMRAWSALEHAGNGALRWGEELEVVGIKAG